MQRCAIDIHHHYVPERVVGEAKRHGNALGIQIFEDKDGTIRFSFNGGPRYPLLQGLTDVERRLAMMEKGKVALAVLDPSTQLMGYDLKGEQAESWCRLYNECVKEFYRQLSRAFYSDGRGADPGTGAGRSGFGSRSHPTRFPRRLYRHQR
jgi:hypothetical protein